MNGCTPIPRMKTSITTRVDHENVAKGDVVIIKRTFVDPKLPAGQQLMTSCTHCDQLFPTKFRRMGRLGSSRALEVRNIPQCGGCRSRYKKDEPTVALPGQGELPRAQERDLRAPEPVAPPSQRAYEVGDVVRVIDTGIENLPYGSEHVVAGVDITFPHDPLIKLGDGRKRLPRRFELVRRASDRKPGELRAGDRVRCIRGGNFPGDPLIEGEIYTVRGVKLFGGADEGIYISLVERPAHGLASHASRFVRVSA